MSKSSLLTGLCRPAPRKLSARTIPCLLARAARRTSARPSIHPSLCHSSRHASTSAATSVYQHEWNDTQQDELEASLLVQEPEVVQESEVASEPVTRPPKDQMLSVDAWLAVLEPQLPDELRKRTVPAAPPVRLFRILWEARAYRDIEIMVELGFGEGGRWSAVEWVLNRLIDQAKSAVPVASLAELVLSIPTDKEKRLDEVADTKSKKWMEPGWLESIVTGKDATTGHLRQAASRLAHVTETDRFRAQTEVWSALGSIIKRASSEPTSSDAMETVLRIMSRLYHEGLMPERLMQRPQMLAAETPSESTQALRIDSVLTTLGQMVPSATSSTSGYSPSMLTTCFEFVLWALVYSGRSYEAAQLLTSHQGLKSRLGYEEHDPPTQVAGPAKHSEANPISQQEGEGAALDRVHEKNMVSEEIIAAAIEGIVLHIPSEGLHQNARAQMMIKNMRRLQMLRTHLEVSGGTLRPATWDHVVARMSEHILSDTSRNPQFTRAMLSLAETYGEREAQSEGEHKPHTSFLYDVSAATIGIYHQALQAQVEARDVRGAIATLGQLQNFTDTNKKRSLNSFMTALGRTKVADLHGNKLELQTTGPQGELQLQNLAGEEYASCFPSIPPATLGGLLNLMLEAGMEDLCGWMIRSEDIDGPLIGPELFSHPLVVPALVRYAAGTDDVEMLRRVTTGQEKRLVPEVLVALCSSYMGQANWPGALHTISLCNKYGLHVWTMKDVALLCKGLIGNIQTRLQPSSATGAEFILQKLLRGDLLLAQGPSAKEMEAVAEVISSVDDKMASLCQNALHPEGARKSSPSTQVFNMLFQGIAEAYGSLRARHLYVEWCTAGQNSTISESRQEQRLADGSVKSVAELFGRAEEKITTTSVPGFSIRRQEPARVKPNLATIRIVIEQALKESRFYEHEYIANTVDDSLPRAEPFFTEAETMGWAADMLRSDFGMKDTDIDYELQGYLTAQKAAAADLGSAESVYQEQTLFVWRALSERHRAWATIAERKVRSFALNKMETHLETEPLGAAEQYFLHCLAQEFGLSSETVGEGNARAVALFKSSSMTHYQPQVPKVTVEAAARSFFGS